MTLLGAADEPSCYSRLVNDWVCLDYVSDRRSEIVDATVQHLGITVAELTATTVVIGLALYALTILVRSLLEGLRAVPDDVRESATGLGYGRGALLMKVELPLALPVIMAGLRVATVSTVALTTVGSLVAYGGLGNLIKDGVLTNFRAELFTASVLCVVLAVVLDALLVLLQRLMTPWTRGVRA